MRTVEGDERFEEFQRFLYTTALVAREGRLARFAYMGSTRDPEGLAVS